MTQPTLYRMAAFRAGSLPDAKAHLDGLIIVHSVDDSSHTLMQSDGVQWFAVGTTPTIASTQQAIDGTDNASFITPLRLNEVLAALGLSAGPGGNAYVDLGYVDPGYVQ